MTVHDKKGGDAVAAETPLEIQLRLSDGHEVAQILNELGEPGSAVMRFNFETADPTILRALQAACERNGLDLVVKPLRDATQDSDYGPVTLPGGFLRKPN